MAWEGFELCHHGLFVIKECQRNQTAIFNVPGLPFGCFQGLLEVEQFTEIDTMYDF